MTSVFNATAILALVLVAVWLGFALMLLDFLMNHAMALILGTVATVLTLILGGHLAARA